MDTHVQISPKALDASSARKLRRRGEIIDAATAVFAESGYHRASINDIIAQAGIARGTFYLYFDGKHSIFESILNHALSGLKACIQPIDISVGASPPRDQLQQNIKRLFEFATHHASLMKLIFSPGISPTDEISSQISGFYKMVQELITSSLEHGIKLGLVDSCDTEIVAAAALGAMQGVIRNYIEADRPIDVQLATENILGFALRGVLTTSLRSEITPKT